MNVLLVGPRIADFDPGYNQSIANAFKQDGHTTEILEYFEPSPPGIWNRMLIDVPRIWGIDAGLDRYIRRFNERLIETSQAFNPDLVVVIKGNKVLTETLKAMKGRVKVLWCYDTIRQSHVSAEQIKQYDKRYAFEQSDLAWAKENMQAEFDYLPMAFDPTTYYPMEGVARDVDVFFVGAYYPNRRETLERLAEDFPDLNLKFLGRHVRYKQPSSWVKAIQYKLHGKGDVFINRCLDAAEVNKMYNRSKICLNMHHAQSKSSYNPRAYEILGSGSFQLSDGVADDRHESMELTECYQDYDQLKEKIREHLAKDPMDHETLMAARDRAVEAHSFANRTRKIMDDIRQL